MRRHFGDIFAENKNLSTGRGDQTADDVKESRLACPVRSDQHAPLTRLYSDINISQSLEPSEILGYVFYDERFQSNALLISCLIGP